MYSPAQGTSNMESLLGHHRKENLLLGFCNPEKKAIWTLTLYYPLYIISFAIQFLLKIHEYL